MEDKLEAGARTADSSSSRGGAGGPADARVYPGAPVSGGSGSGSTESAAGAARRRGPLVLLAVSLALMIGSAAYLVAGPGGGDGAPALFATVQDDSSSDAPKGEGAAAEGGATQAADSGEGASAEAPVVHADASISASSSGDSSSSAPSDQASGSVAGESEAGQTDAQAPATVTVRVVVDSSAVGGSVSADTTLSFDPGVSAYDALCGTGLSVNARDSGFGVYVAAIGGLAEKEHGGESGWKYSVNGTFPGYASSGYELKDGDVVKWVYVTKA